jgi:hypothetical protein
VAQPGGCFEAAKSRDEPMRRPYEQAHACAMSGDFETESAA